MAPYKRWGGRAQQQSGQTQHSTLLYIVSGQKRESKNKITAAAAAALAKT